MRYVLIGRALAALAIVTVASTTLLDARKAHAFTLVELTAWAFPPVDLSQNQTAELCSINWGDATVSVNLGIVSADNILQSKKETLAPNSTVCLSYVEPNQQTISAFVTTTRNTAAEKLALAHVISSMQLKDSNGSLFVVTTPVLLPAVQLPAVQLPAVQ